MRHLEQSTRVTAPVCFFLSPLRTSVLRQIMPSFARSSFEMCTCRNFLRRCMGASARNFRCFLGWPLFVIIIINSYHCCRDCRNLWEAVRNLAAYCALYFGSDRQPLIVYYHYRVVLKLYAHAVCAAEFLSLAHHDRLEDFLFHCKRAFFHRNRHDVAHAHLWVHAAHRVRAFCAYYLHYLC